MDEPPTMDDVHTLDESCALPDDWSEVESPDQIVEKYDPRPVTLFTYEGARSASTSYQTSRITPTPTPTSTAWRSSAAPATNSNPPSRSP